MRSKDNRLQSKRLRESTQGENGGETNFIESNLQVVFSVQLVLVTANARSKNWHSTFSTFLSYGALRLFTIPFLIAKGHPRFMLAKIKSWVVKM